MSWAVASTSGPSRADRDGCRVATAAAALVGGDDGAPAAARRPPLPLFFLFYRRPACAAHPHGCAPLPTVLVEWRILGAGPSIRRVVAPLFVSCFCREHRRPATGVRRVPPAAALCALESLREESVSSTATVLLVDASAPRQSRSTTRCWLCGVVTVVVGALTGRHPPRALLWLCPVPTLVRQVDDWRRRLLVL